MPLPAGIRATAHWPRISYNTHSSSYGKPVRGFCPPRAWPALRDYIPTQSEYKDTTAPASEFLPDLERHNLMEQLDKAIGQLSPQKIEVCRLKIHEGLSNAEIAEKLGISINTVKVLYHQAVTQLRKLMHSGYAILLILLVSR